MEKNYLTSEVAEQTYATTEAVSDISEAVEGIEKDIKTLNDGFVTLGLPGDFSDKVDESSTILASIFEKLSTLENDIIEIKNKINELHPDDDPSDPDNGENPNEPEDPELNGSEENPESEPIE